ncbi:Na(+)-translocating NADH-quinone reductase subunit C [Pasteurella skyensis]|uniref:Na(+)-translocating NADH-quinone reductase subunit C n=1 Tax=Phocoenobacter skyensis TaxID=97481 RepID=A0AAJ6N950_9PAST|nr:Na(+)-translocating NADH-quinone reductase subunit C [Pasteurella skyensis]MDP8162516.1 Na(+)-translocating NADH-quinone reductase subunit C [Pasteurella skyensis]MDP8172481.1 Na(+)-translocating NADH-quinone reductase subunit C [Pasteurella skyensis]MDP8177506.1 Na(+)-translocating NADH-quinone reductase subunit C [Pasteurella skyensis]MDP8178736.1 Na(+)-translocating NADH-quinone reductase subunit C [Pasteurella skyensis]MDP8182974.1 Na(+)-translocating NADH-quinone reductase subunit C [P
MFKNKDSIGGTISIVVLLSLVCSIIVAGSAVLLKSAQEEQKALDKQKNILNVAGLLKGDVTKKEVKQIYTKNIEPRIVDLATGEYVDGIKNFDARVAAKDPAQNVKILPNDDKASIRTRAKYAEVYLVKGEDNQLNQVIVPIYGTGLWSVMYGFISIQPDGNTINGITYYEQGETPGLGGEIENPKWQAQFKGKKLLNEKGESAITVGKAASADKEHGIDALSGATLTSRGVDGTFKYWFSKNGFGPYLAKLKAGAN